MEFAHNPVQDITPMVIANHGPVHTIRKILETREVGVFHSVIQPRGGLPREVHKFVEVIYRIRGTTNMLIGDQDYLIGPGDYAIVPEGVWHQTTSLEDHDTVEQLVLVAYSQLPGECMQALLSTAQKLVVQ